MIDPVFRLEGVVHDHGEMENFEGPLTLILQLLSKNKLDIQDISISLILDQYLDYLKELEEMDLDVASEFVAMASHLAYIKSRMLLVGEGEQVSELEELKRGLEKLRRKDEYAKIRQITGKLGDLYFSGANRLVKMQENIPDAKKYPYQHTAGDLLHAMKNLLVREEIKARLSIKKDIYVPMKVIYPVEEKTSEIMEQLKTYSTILLDGLFYSCKSRSEVVAVFVAVLEMSKAGLIVLTGEESRLVLKLGSCQSIVDKSAIEMEN